MTWWNPYAPLAPSQRRALGIAAVVTVLVLWSVVAGFGWVAPNKLPPPWKVAKAFATSHGAGSLLGPTSAKPAATAHSASTRATLPKPIARR